MLRDFCHHNRNRLIRKSTAGFTLLEILVVVFIIGIILSLVVISVNPDKDDELKTEADRFITLVSLATQESILLSKEFALDLSHDGYSFLAFEDQQWTATSDGVFRARSFPQGVYMDIYLEGEKYDFMDAEEEENNPRIFLLSSGEMTPFEIILQSEDSQESFHITGDISGKLTMDEEQ